MKTFKLYLLALGLFSLLFCGGFLLAEVLLRSSIAANATESRSHVIPTLYMPIKLKPNFAGELWQIPFSTNDFGFRGEEDFKREPSLSEYRILSLGDSIGFGLGISAADHYTQRAEAALEESLPGRTVKIVNAGGQGYSPSGYFAYLKHEGLLLKPDMVIIETELCNDVTDEALLRWQPESPLDPRPDAVIGGRYEVAWDGSLLATYSVGDYFFERTYVYTDLLRRYLNLRFRLTPNQPFREQDQNGVCYYNLGFDRFLLTEERIESGWQKNFGALKSTVQLLEEGGVSFLLMIMPSRYVFDEEDSPWRRFASRLVRRALEEADSGKIPHLDLTSAIRKGGGPALFFDFAHLTEEGNQVVGEALAANLRLRLGSSGLAAEPDRPEVP